MNIRLLNRQPWRFKPGAHVYVRGWAPDATGLVTDLLLAGTNDLGCFPHYLVVDEAGVEWQISQLQLSSRPITFVA
jgi:hypothetical protein